MSTNIKRITSEEVQSYYEANQEEVDAVDMAPTNGLNVELWFGLYSTDVLVSVASIAIDNQDNETFISNCYTLSSYRGRGYMSLLLAHIDEVLKPLGTKLITFARPTSEKLFKALGFVEPEFPHKKLIKLPE